MKNSKPLLFFIYRKASRSGGDFSKGRRKRTNQSSDPLSQITPIDLAFFTYFQIHSMARVCIDGQKRINQGGSLAILKLKVLWKLKALGN